MKPSKIGNEATKDHPSKTEKMCCFGGRSWCFARFLHDFFSGVLDLLLD